MYPTAAVQRQLLAWMTYWMFDFLKRIIIILFIFAGVHECSPSKEKCFHFVCGDHPGRGNPEKLNRGS